LQGFGTTPTAAAISDIKFHLPPIIASDPGRQFTITEIQLVVALPISASATFSWSALAVLPGGGSEVFPTIPSTADKVDAYADSELATPIRWMYATLASRKTITADSLWIQNTLSYTGGSPFITPRIYAVRVFVTEGPLFYE
jgi:hypothetical protein